MSKGKGKGACAGSLRLRARELLWNSWFQTRPQGLAAALWPLAALYGILQRRDRARREQRARVLPQPQVPVLVVGNLVPGGAGKTPTTIALVQALRAAGWKPGVVSRGYGRTRRAGRAITLVHADAAAEQVGDEPLVIARRTGVPVIVGADRRAAALQLLQQHPEIDLLIADDGLQHRQLRRDLEVVLFDERGAGNGLLLPAGPLREAMPAQPPPGVLVLYNHPRPSTAWPGAVAQRRLAGAWPLGQWLADASTPPAALTTLQGRSLLAVAGIAVPERFFAALEAQGLRIERLALPDHYAYGPTPPWPAPTREIVTTEKDAVKLAHLAGSETRIWVVGLDLLLPAAFVATLRARLAPASAP